MKPKNFRSQKARTALLCMLAPVAVMSASSVHAFGMFVSSWQAHYSTSQTDENVAASGSTCALCHVPGNYSQFNGYGWALKQNGMNYTAVESLNSDGDPTGATNLEEINANTQPGWTTGPNNVINGGSVSSNALPPVGIAGNLDPVAVNQPPTADAGGPYTGTEGLQLSFDGSASADADGTIVSYDWDFGDGSAGTGPTPTHTYTGTGVFNVSLLVTDDAGDTGTATTTATIAAGNQPPTANAGGPYVGTEGVPIAFDGSGSTDSDGTLVSYDWDFGDGSTGSGVAPSHTYATQGIYNVTLTVMDDSGVTDSANTTAAVDAASLPPTADPNGPYTGTLGAAVVFDGSGSVDLDGTIVSYAWDFGDGATGSGVTPSHTYAAEGTYNVTLTVTDDSGLSNTAVTTAVIGPVVNLPPVANANGPYAGTVGLPVTFDSSGSDDSDGTLVAYDWDFGDGTAGTGAAPTHTYVVAGIYSVTLTVTDDSGAMDSSSTTATIGVGNQAPVANANGPYNGTVGMAVQFDSTGSSDSDGTITTYDWDFGDGTTGTGPNPSHTYTAVGAYNVILTVTDNDGATDSSATTATIAPVTSDADVFLTELWARKSLRLRVGKRESMEIIALGGATSVRQDATVDLDVTAPDEGLGVYIKETSKTEEVVPGEDPEQFEFKAKLACEKQGTYTLDWSATISADQNSDLSNDTETGTTMVKCVRESDDDDDDDDDDDHDDDGDHHDDDDDDDDEGKKRRGDD